MNTVKDTIVALATAPLPAGVAIIRLSGPQAWQAAATLSTKITTLQPHSAIFCRFKSEGTTLDDGLALGFKAPKSFTGEDVIELHCHGGPAVIEALLNHLLKQDNIRHAQPGEFTRRAVENGKLNLVEAEGLIDLVHAQTEEQRKLAHRQLAGEFGQRFETWRQNILHLLAHTEAALDFPDEELDILSSANLQTKIDDIIAHLQESLATQGGERLREGFRIAIVGKPNAGKSTLTNLLTGHETAIVSPIAGTTRDVIEAHLNIAGFPVILADTAGLRQTEDTIEAEGVKRAKTQAEQADITIAVIDAADWPQLPQDVTLTPAKSLILVSKTDTTATQLPQTHKNDIPVLGVNLTDATCLPSILNTLKTLIEQQFSTNREAAILTRQRHRDAVQNSLQSLQRAKNLMETPNPQTSLAELLAQDLRDAAFAIGTVTGKTTSEDVLDLVFSTFCIGK